MGIGLIGKKCGMTRMYLEDGSAVSLSVVHVDPNRVVQIKTPEVDGYSAIQVTTGSQKRSRLTKAVAGHYAKAGVDAGVGLFEIRVSDDDLGKFSIGAQLGVDTFEAGAYVDVRGQSIGKGFAGVVKRHNFRTQDATHGNSRSHRAPGSIGQNQSPGRVFKGKRMAGHMGAETVTVQNLKICSVDAERSLLLIQGAIPGAKGSHVYVRPAVKKG
ncbi:50S ribosomal protein L3 [Methylotetracoccus oryzae]|uniref:50S ribosomal protein L3 n=1 Tax=Methylotetracoccus oryzae TaxID=1919059 RepID=UPI001119EFD2|nr:50S ribosomal protein L3 [Methylotetracoccus oryzae]